jgi:uncharacterized membrane protein YhaH (DUF805 family)
MTFIAAIRSCFRNYAPFTGSKGRAPRSEFWYFFLFNAIVLLAVYIIERAFQAEVIDQATGTGVFFALTAMAFIPPNLSVTIRRLHDTNHSGWWYWIQLTIIGIIPLLVWMLKKGTPGDNRFGENPLRAHNRDLSNHVSPIIPSQDKLDQIIKLKQLLETGAISEQEFGKLEQIPINRSCNRHVRRSLRILLA